MALYGAQIAVNRVPAYIPCGPQTRSTPTARTDRSTKGRPDKRKISRTRPEESPLARSLTRARRRPPFTRSHDGRARAHTDTHGHARTRPPVRFTTHTRTPTLAYTHALTYAKYDEKKKSPPPPPKRAARTSAAAAAVPLALFP